MKPEGISPAEWSALNRTEESSAAADPNPNSGPDPSPHAFPPLQQGAAGLGSGPIGLLAHVELEVTVVLGQTKRSIKDVLSLAPGSVLELDRAAGDTVDILVNGRLVAKGEVVVVGENFGVRITDLLQAEGALP